MVFGVWEVSEVWLSNEQCDEHDAGVGDDVVDGAERVYGGLSELPAQEPSDGGDPEDLGVDRVERVVLRREQPFERRELRRRSLRWRWCGIELVGERMTDELAAQVDYEDVDEVIELASRMRQESQGRLTPEELQEIGEELGIPAQYVERAREELGRRRIQADEAEREAKARRQMLVWRGGIGAVVVVVVFGVWSMFAVSNLRTLYAGVEAHEAEIANLRERQASVVELYAGRPDSPDRDAEIVGAENRVRVAMQRHGEAAAAYNERAGRFPATLWAPVVGLPSRVEPGGR
jgi:hypothetical protein